MWKFDRTLRLCEKSGGRFTFPAASSFPGENSSERARKNHFRRNGRFFASDRFAASRTLDRTKNVRRSDQGEQFDAQGGTRTRRLRAASVKGTEIILVGVGGWGQARSKPLLLFCTEDVSELEWLRGWIYVACDMEMWTRWATGQIYVDGCVERMDRKGVWIM